MIRILFIIFGVVLVFWGLYRMKKDEGLVGRTQKSKNIFNLLLMGQASGLGQFLSGVVCIILGILSFITR